MSKVKVHPQSESGYTAGEEYNKACPLYPNDALTFIRDQFQDKHGVKIIEFGCGSGKFTKSLMANTEWNSLIGKLHCVESVEGMLKVLKETVQDPRVRTYRGTSDISSIQESAFADLIVTATSFHWCLDFEAAMKEFLQLLKPDGSMCFLWNMEDRKTAAWLEEFMQITEANRDRPTTGEHKVHNVKSDNIWRRTFDLPAYKENFDPPVETTFRFVTPSTIYSVWARCRTWSRVGAMSEENKERMRGELEKVIRRGNSLVYIDKAGGIIEVPSEVPVIIMKRKVLY